ncbi:short chain dehydrogenase [Thalassomonas haliotis]|uniref:Short chain dehydrogenase n=1 Tax=Thalassomonas haliotis TaxID=485448 RepID=A0ABY7VF89_9GAMM|nr:short chain dehydrogenase [Thalassomonas haliotis]WDE11558.1 short chain dehydrogenase [Thalassomonas haliotis]
MKILIIGATGTIGQAIRAKMQDQHELILASKNNSEHQVDITSSKSIKALFDRVGKLDAIVSVTGNLHFGPISEMNAEQFRMGLNDKLLGQVDITLIGQHYLNLGGSITLTSGIVSDEPILGGANATTVNAAIDGFVKAAAIELKNNIRINSVNPTMVEESREIYGPFFPGYEAVPVAEVANAFVRSIEGPQTGRVYRVW